MKDHSTSDLYTDPDTGVGTNVGKNDPDTQTGQKSTTRSKKNTKNT